VGEKFQRVPGYRQQCITAIARALPEDDEYRHSIADKSRQDPRWTLEQLSGEYLGIPVNCCHPEFNGTKPILRMDEVEAKGEYSGLGKLFLQTERIVSEDERPAAMFIRLSQPERLNVVVHRLYELRLWHNPEVLASFTPSGQRPVFVERRTTFCRLLASIGLWSVDRPNRVVKFDYDHDGTSDCNYDLRRVVPKDRYRAAVSFAGRRRIQRTRTLAYRDLSDKQFVQKVMEMQMAHRIKTGRWK
jgi:hypothetical protein